MAEFDTLLSELPVFFNTHYDSNEPMRLCQVCKRLSLSKLWEASQTESYVRHQRSYATMRAASSKGCQLCRLVSKSVSSDFAIDKGISVDEANTILEAPNLNDTIGCIVSIGRVAHSTHEKANPLIDSIVFYVPHDPHASWGRQPLKPQPHLASGFAIATFTLRALPPHSEMTQCQIRSLMIF